jgi:Transposase DDE domain group 1
MLTSGKVGYEVGGNVDVTPYGGVAAVHRLVTRVGLVEAINDGLHLLKIHLPYHESDHVLNLAYNVLTGGTRLEDIERLRHDVAYMNALGAQLIPDPTTAGDFCRRFGEADVVALMDAVNAVRPKLWAGRGQDLLAQVAYIDVDGTIVPTTGSRKQGMDISYKGIWGYAPLLVTLANTREVLFVVNRPGNAPSHQNAAEWIDKAIDLVAAHAPRVCVRGDSDFSLTAHFDRWAARVDFIFGMDNNTPLRRIADGLDESAWTRLHRQAPYHSATGTTRARRDNTKQRIVSQRGFLNLELNYEDVACFDYRPGNAPAPTEWSRCARTSAAAAATRSCSTRSAISITSPPTPT